MSAARDETGYDFYEDADEECGEEAFKRYMTLHPEHYEVI